MIAVSVIISTLIIISDGFLLRLSPEEKEYAAMTNKETFFKLYDRGGCFLDYYQGPQHYDLKKCANEFTPNKMRVLIWGDSFAAHLYPGLKSKLSQKEISVHQFTATSCRPLVMGVRRCDKIYSLIDNVVNRLNPDVVIIAGYWPKVIKKLGEELFSKRLTESISKLQKSGIHIILTGQSPTYKYSLAKLGFLHEENRTGTQVSMAATNHRTTQAIILRIALQNKVEFVDFYDLCEDTECLAFSNGEPLHWDTMHMTMAGSMHYVQVLVEAIDHWQQSYGAAKISKLTH
jgi:hypothetical protein